jgi:hypothetical protein
MAIKNEKNPKDPQLRIVILNIRSCLEILDLRFALALKLQRGNPSPESSSFLCFGKLELGNEQ